jgi:hypothetical protein
MRLLKLLAVYADERWQEILAETLPNKGIANDPEKSKSQCEYYTHRLERP